VAYTLWANFYFQKSAFTNRTSSIPEIFLSVIGQSETRDVIAFMVATLCDVRDN